MLRKLAHRAAAGRPVVLLQRAGGAGGLDWLAELLRLLIFLGQGAPSPIFSGSPACLWKRLAW